MTVEEMLSDTELQEIADKYHLHTSNDLTLYAENIKRSLKNQLQEKDKQIEELKKFVFQMDDVSDNKDERIKNYIHSIISKDKQIEELKEQLDKAKNKITELEAQIEKTKCCGNCKHKGCEFKSIKYCNSWELEE